MHNNYRYGYLEVISGCMFSGKTEELLRRYNTMTYAKRRIQVFNHASDKRYDGDANITSHNGQKISSIAARDANDIEKNLKPDTEVLMIDEAQFFDTGLIKLIKKVTLDGVLVIVAGLDQDFRGEPFPIMASLLTEAEFVTKLSAICMQCGSTATKSQRLVDGEPASYHDQTVVVGASEAYEARCRHCHEIK